MTPQVRRPLQIPDWVDRCGQAVGFYWLLMVPLFTWFSIIGWE